MCEILSDTTLITLITLVQYRNTDGQHTIVLCAIVVRKFKENANNRPIFSQHNIFTNISIKFFNLCSDLPFQSSPKKSIKSETDCAVARPVLVICCTLTTGDCNTFQHIFVNKKKCDFYGPYFQTMLFLVTMIRSRTVTNIFLEKVQHKNPTC